MADPVQLTRKIRDAFEPCSLGRWPTPCQPVPGLAAAAGLDALWAKREDRSAAVGGGSKVRALEFLLAGTPPQTVFVTVGATGSTHCLATAVHARALGRRSALAQFPQPDTDSARAVAAASAGAADVVCRARTGLGLPFALARAWRVARALGVPHWIPGGGAAPRAVLGHALAGLELASQLGAPPDAIVVPLGSGGTTAGLTIAVGWLGWPTTIVAVRVAPAFVANRWRVRTLAAGAERLLRRVDLPVPHPASPVPLLVVNALGAGYGHPSSAGEVARRLAAEHGLVLDPTYGAKALAVLLQRATGNPQRVVFWHTFAAP